MKDYTDIISNRIKTARKEKRLSQETLAQKLQVSRKTVGKWENGEALPELPSFLDLCHVLECDTGYLLGEHKTKKKINFNIYEETGLTEDVIEILKADFQKFDVYYSQNGFRLSKEEINELDCPNIPESCDISSFLNYFILHGEKLISLIHDETSIYAPCHKSSTGFLWFNVCDEICNKLRMQEQKNNNQQSRLNYVLLHADEIITELKNYNYTPPLKGILNLACDGIARIAEYEFEEEESDTPKLPPQDTLDFFFTEILHHYVKELDKEESKEFRLYKIQEEFTNLVKSYLNSAAN